MTVHPEKVVPVVPVIPAMPRTEPGRPSRRALVPALAVAAATLVGASWWLPYWSFRLVAPQYPKGLDLRIALYGVTGDVAEIDILNHYIGMMPMSTAAALEAAASPWVVGAVALGVLAGLLLTGGRWAWLALVPALGLPLGFLADVTYWMYRFGHELDPDAPLTFEPFMPVLVGPGTIGQFHTTAWPAAGFWLVSLAAVLVGIAVAAKRRERP